jgi:hypothetical protein
MTNQEINIAIAGACGWRDIKRCTRRLKPDAQGVALMGIDPNGDHTGGATEYASVPSYTTDLNAMHEAEKTLTHAEMALYMAWLPVHDYHCIRATAAQRAEAFRRTKGLWREAGTESAK